MQQLLLDLFNMCLLSQLFSSAITYHKLHSIHLYYSHHSTSTLKSLPNILTYKLATKQQPKHTHSFHYSLFTIPFPNSTLHLHIHSHIISHFLFSSSSHHAAHTLHSLCILITLSIISLINSFHHNLMHSSYILGNYTNLTAAILSIISIQ